MAVLDGVPHVTVRVRVGGEIATEHEAPSDQVPAVSPGPSELPTSHCYIEAKTGAQFSVEMTVNADFSFSQDGRAVMMHVYIDGTWMAGKYIRPSLPGITQTAAVSETWCPAEQGGGPSLRNFVFSSIVTSEASPHDDIAGEIERAKGLGVIKVTLATVRTGGTTPMVMSKGLQGQDKELPEKALKGKELSHRASLAPCARGTPPPQVQVTYSQARELGTIFFHYRSHEALQHEMIIPRNLSPPTQPPATSPVETTLSNLSEDEIRRLASERLRDLHVKNEAGRVKREAESVPRMTRPLKVIKLDNGTEAFDLTED